MTWYRHYNGQVTEQQISQHDRPVVVIDPEDAEQVKRLADAYAQRAGLPKAGPAITATILHALREFAAPTPPARTVDFDLTPAVRQAVAEGAPIIIAGRRYIAEDVTP